MDYALTKQSLIRRFSAFDIGAEVFSDHQPLTFSVQLQLRNPSVAAHQARQDRSRVRKTRTCLSRSAAVESSPSLVGSLGCAVDTLNTSIWRHKKLRKFLKTTVTLCAHARIGTRTRNCGTEAEKLFLWNSLNNCCEQGEHKILLQEILVLAQDISVKSKKKSFLVNQHKWRAIELLRKESPREFWKNLRPGGCSVDCRYLERISASDLYSLFLLSHLTRRELCR